MRSLLEVNRLLVLLVLVLVLVHWDRSCLGENRNGDNFGRGDSEHRRV